MKSAGMFCLGAVIAALVYVAVKVIQANDEVNRAINDTSQIDRDQEAWFQAERLGSRPWQNEIVKEYPGVSWKYDPSAPKALTEGPVEPAQGIIEDDQEAQDAEDDLVALRNAIARDNMVE